MVRDLGGIERQDSAAVQEHGVDAERRPVIHPALGVKVKRIPLVHVDLAAASHR